jgi:glyoxylase-like metal-dependent hydrolase (beta-lactamase superfamily II)
MSLRPLALLLSLAFCSTPVLAQNFDKAQVKAEKLSETSYMLTGAGGNLGLSVGEDAVFLVDDQYAPMAPKIKAAIAAISSKPVKFVINTHWHNDHTGGNEAFAKSDAVVVAHENVRKRMSSDQMIAFLKMDVKASPKAALPVVTFTRDISFHLNGEDLLITHQPNAHTDGDAIVHFKTSNILHMGDLYFNKLYPFIDTSSGGSVEGVIAAVDRALAMANDSTKIIPGHGPLSTKAELAAYRAMLAAIAPRIKQLVKDGKTLDQAIAAKPTAEFDAVWGKGFVPPARFVEMLYNDFKR